MLRIFLLILCSLNMISVLLSYFMNNLNGIVMNGIFAIIMILLSDKCDNT